MEIKELHNGHGDVMEYSITGINSRKWDERKLRAIIKMMEELE